jgi:hypothetical protein
MTAGCITVPNYTSNSQISGLTPGSNYYVTITAVSTTSGYASATTGVSPATLATVQLVAPTGLSANYGTAAGTITLSFTPPVTAAPGQTYTAMACTDSGMTQGCVTNANYVAGSNLSGLAATVGSPGTNYFVTVTANPSSGYLVSPVQLAAPTAVAVGYGTTAGSISVTFTPPTTVAAGQTFTLKACTNPGMSAGCVTNANFTSGSSVTNLPFTAGTVGTTYYVQLTSTASAGYVASAASTAVNHAEMSQIGQPSTPMVSTGNATGNIVATFNTPGTAPSSYSAMACTDPQMSLGCVTKAGYTSGAQFNGLVSGTAYYVQITAIAPAGYVNNTSSTSKTSAKAK